MDVILPSDPAKDLDAYLKVDEWRLFSEVETWKSSGDFKRKRLARQWETLNSRAVKWKMSFSTEISVDRIQRGTGFASAADYERRIRAFLPARLKKLPFRVDLATQDPRPINPMVEGEKRVNIFNPSTAVTSPEPLRDLYRYIPARVVHFRVFALSHDHDGQIAAAAEKTLSGFGELSRTNICKSQDSGPLAYKNRTIHARMPTPQFF